MSATGRALAAIMGYPPSADRSPSPDLNTTATHLPWETVPSDVEMNSNGRPRRAAAPTKMMSIGPPIPLYPMSKINRKSKRKAEVAFDEESQDEMQEHQPDQKSAKRRSGGKRKEIPQAFADDSSDEDYDNVIAVSPPRKKSRVKYMNVTKPNRKPVEADSSPTSPEPTVAKKGKNKSKDKNKDKEKDKVPEAKRKADQANALLGRKGKGRSIPNRVEECDAVDLMMWQWRHSGKSWDEIRAEYVRLTGAIPGRSSLSVRLAKMEDNFIDSGGAKDILLLKIKDDVEKELDTLRWQRVSEKMKLEKHADAHPVTLRKRYMAIKSSGWLLGDSVVEVNAPKGKPNLASLLAARHAATDSEVSPNTAPMLRLDTGDDGDVEDEDDTMVYSGDSD